MVCQGLMDLGKYLKDSPRGAMCFGTSCSVARTSKVHQWLDLSGKNDAGSYLAIFELWP